MKADSMAADYQTLFGGLAKEFGVTVVAGSIALPAPRIEHGKLLPGSGPLYNSSIVFGSDGAPLASRNASCCQRTKNKATSCPARIIS